MYIWCMYLSILIHDVSELVFLAWVLDPDRSDNSVLFTAYGLVGGFAFSLLYYCGTWCFVCSVRLIRCHHSFSSASLTLVVLLSFQSSFLSLDATPLTFEPFLAPWHKVSEVHFVFFLPSTCQLVLFLFFFSPEGKISLIVTSVSQINPAQPETLNYQLIHLTSFIWSGI